MIQLIRVYDKDGRVIAAEAYDHDERPPNHRQCRCIPDPVWRSREKELAYIHAGEYDKITVTSIHLSRRTK